MRSRTAALLAVPALLAALSGCAGSSSGYAPDPPPPTYGDGSNSKLQSAEDYGRQVNAAVASDEDVKQFVERLEQTMDEVTEETPPDRIPSADSIAQDFQRFLRQRRPE